MPRKFRRVLRKGYSVRKPVKVKNCDQVESSEDEAPSDSSTTGQTTCDVGTQTEEIPISESVTQTEISFSHHTEVSTQTEMDSTYSMTDSATKEGIPVTHVAHIYDVCVYTTINVAQGLVPVACEGNNDTKFLPLVEKNKGIFKNTSGMYLKN